MRATLKELSSRGYVALSIDAVAAEAKVNKTTIYRRWPTKPELVTATLQANATSHGVTLPPERGSLRSELLEYLRHLVDSVSTPEGRALLRVMQVDRADPELDAIIQQQRMRRQAVGVELMQRAIARRELSPDANAELIIELLFSTVTTRLYASADVSEPALSALVEVVLFGGLPRPPAA